jgi:hypothetical protein
MLFAILPRFEANGAFGRQPEAIAQKRANGRLNNRSMRRLKTT